jgi:DNA repair exonuclease SbcCD nuclease subunit
MKKAKSIAVLISDIHFNVNTLELASRSLLKAQFRAALLKVPLVIAGDLLDTKAIIRAEVANRLIEMMSVHGAPDTIVLVGNHDLCNEKGENHALNFLKPYCTVVDCPQVGRLSEVETLMIPYQTNTDVIRNILQDKENPAPKLVIMHQGIIGSQSGDYFQDRTALQPKDVATFRVISGHYHTRQTIDTPKDGKWDYIGNPYTLNFSEASDPEKGFQILHDDGSLEFVPTNLRKHVVVEIEMGFNTALYTNADKYKKGDLLWVKLSGTKERLAGVTKKTVQIMLGLDDTNFKLDLIHTDSAKITPKKSSSQPEILDSMIDGLTDVTPERKLVIKDLWKGLT